LVQLGKLSTGEIHRVCMGIRTLCGTDARSVATFGVVMSKTLDIQEDKFNLLSWYAGMFKQLTPAEARVFEKSSPSASTESISNFMFMSK
jgi:hypothetical protein